MSSTFTDSTITALLEDVRHTAVTQSPLHAWLQEILWDWSCEECGKIDDCDHYLASRNTDGWLLEEDLRKSLKVLQALVQKHVSSVRVLEALGGDSRQSVGEAHCLSCYQPWPCLITVEANKSVQPLMEDWLAEKDWWRDPEWLGKPSSRQPSEMASSVAGDEKPVICPRCGDDVTEGIEEWRASVNAVFRYVSGFQALLTDTIYQTDQRRESADQAFHNGEHGGLQLARSLAGSKFIALVHSHHPHASFIRAEQDAGRINSAIPL